jgi:pimeloyl-ACP methyl ester carboxylesterase
MITFILPGYSPSNKEWLEECAGSLKVEGTIRPIFWEHWEDPDVKFQPKEKASLIARHTKGDKINIIAKSIGTLVATYIIEQIPNQINKVIVCGIPLGDIKGQEAVIKKVLGSLDRGKIICFQNENDPLGSFAEVRKFLPPEIKLISKPRSDHSYPYYSEFNNFLI